MGRKVYYNIFRQVLFMLLFLAFALKANAGETHWQVNENAYQYDMQMYIRLMSDGETVERWDEVELAAFSGNECRGIAVPLSVGNGAVKLYSMRVRSNMEGELISFKFYDKSLAKEFILLQTVRFVSDGTYGDIRNPFVLSTSVELVPDEATNAIYVSPGGSANGSSPDKAAGDIQQAIDRASALGASSVRLLPGTYCLVKTLELPLGVSLKGEGDAPAVLDGQGKVRVLEIIGNASRAVTGQTTISRLTLKNGYVDGNGGAVLLNDNTLIEECLFKDNKCTGKGGALYGGKASRCLFENNSAPQGGAAAVTVLDFCTLVKNSSTGTSAAAYRSTLTNSIVWGNGGGAQIDGCILRGVAVEAQKGSLSGEKIIYLTAGNTYAGEEGYRAPVFEDPANGVWTLGENSPLSKLAIVGGKRCDLGYNNGAKNTRAWVCTSLVLQGALVYKEAYAPLASGVDIWGQAVVDLNTVFQYRAVGETAWSIVKPVKAGKYQSKASIPAADVNWCSNEFTEQVTDFTILPRRVTITAQTATKVYGEKDPLLTYTLSETLDAGALQGTLTREPGEHVGNYPVIRGTLQLSSDYDMLFQQATFIISKRPVTVTAADVPKVYGEADPQLTYQVQSAMGNALVGEDKPTGTLVREPGEKIGKYSITQGTLALSADYELSYKPGMLTIDKRPLTITAEPASKVYGEEDPAFDYRISESTLVDGDAFTGVLSREPGERAGIYALTLGTLALNENYILTFIPSRLVIGKRPVTLQAVPCTKKYGESDPVFDYTLTSAYTPALKEGDAVSGKLVRETGEHIGVYNLLQGSLLLPEDYECSFVAAPLTIVPLPVTVKAGGGTKIYGDPDPELVYTVEPQLVGSDYFNGRLQRRAGEEVGNYAIEQGSLSLSENYELNFYSAELVVIPKTIEVVLNNHSSVYGEKDEELTYRYHPSLIGKDKFSGKPERAQGTDAGTYTIGQGSLAISGNYVLQTTPAAYTVTPRPVIIRAVDRKKVYGESDPLLRLEAEGMGLIGKDSYSGSLLREEGEDVGNYKIMLGSLSLPGNYKIDSFIGATFEITPAQPVITIEKLVQVYDRLPKEAKVTTDPEGLEYTVTYNGTDQIPVEVGEYEVQIAVNTRNYVGSKQETLRIVEPQDEMVVCTKVSSLSENAVFETQYIELCIEPCLRVYNERGKQLYEKNNYQNGEFDFRGKPVGTYYYILTYKLESGERKTQKGFVELIP